jgi:hypothetical protein
VRLSAALPLPLPLPRERGVELLELQSIERGLRSSPHVGGVETLQRFWGKDIVSHVSPHIFTSPDTRPTTTRGTNSALHCLQVAASAALAMETNRCAGPSRDGDDGKMAIDTFTTQRALCAEGYDVGSMARSSNLGRIKTKGLFNLMFLPTELRMKVGSYSFNVAASLNEYISKESLRRVPRLKL